MRFLPLLLFAAPLAAQTPTQAFYGLYAPSGDGATALTHCTRDSLVVLPITTNTTTDPGSWEGIWEQGVLSQAEWQDTTILKVIIDEIGGRDNASQTIIDMGPRCVMAAFQTSPTIRYLHVSQLRDSTATDFVIRNATFEPQGDSVATLLSIAGGSSHTGCKDCLFTALSIRFTSNDAYSFRAGAPGDSLMRVGFQYSVYGPLVNNARLGGILEDSIGALECGNITWLKNLWFEGIRRAPIMQCGGAGGNSVVNTVGYNNTDAGRIEYKSAVQFINNLIIRGPGSNCDKDRMITYFDAGPEPDSAEIHLSGNKGVVKSSCGWPSDTITKQWGASADTTVLHFNSATTSVDSSKFQRYTPFTPSFPFSDTIPAGKALLDTINALSGNVKYLQCDGTWTDRTDVVSDTIRVLVANDRGIANQENPIYAGRSGWESTYGGKSESATGSACADVDGDKLPNAYEKRVQGASDSTSLSPSTLITPENIFVMEAYLSGLHPDSVSESGGGGSPSIIPLIMYNRLIQGILAFVALFSVYMALRERRKQLTEGVVARGEREAARALLDAETLPINELDRVFREGKWEPVHRKDRKWPRN